MEHTRGCLDSIREMVHAGFFPDIVHENQTLAWEQMVLESDCSLKHSFAAQLGHDGTFGMLQIP